MKDDYELGYQVMVDAIGGYSPETASVLQILHDQEGIQLAFYAGIVIIYLEHQMKHTPWRSLKEVIAENLQSFTFFDETKDNPAARALFTQALNCYWTDFNRRFGAQPAG